MEISFQLLKYTDLRQKTWRYVPPAMAIYKLVL